MNRPPVMGFVMLVLVCMCIALLVGGCVLRKYL